MKRLLLVGNAETHRAIAQSITDAPGDTIATVLVTSSVSGSDLLLPCPDLSALCADVRIVFDELAALDVGASTAIFRSGRKLGYDFISLNTGAETDLSCLALLGDRLLPLKPLDRFYPKWQELLSFSPLFEPLKLVVIADDPSTLSMVACISCALEQKRANFSLVLVLTGSSGARMGAQQQEMLARLRQSGRFELHYAQAAGTNTGVLLSDGSELYADRVIVAANTRPPPWLGITPLHRDNNGLIVVDDQNRSVSHGNVFAFGDMAATAMESGAVKSPAAQRNVTLDNPT